MVISEKFELLKEYISDVGRKGVVVAFSGGVDSSTLAAICHMVLGERAVAVFVQSPVNACEELLTAKSVAVEIGIHFYVVQADVLLDSFFTANSENRCYFCKKELIACLKQFAGQLGFKVVFEGTNFSDLSGHRPGFKAVQESLDVYSPWVENGFSKDEIRRLAEHLGLSVYDKPSLACLASRIPFNQKITLEKLVRVDSAERAIREISGVVQVRVRDHDGLARIEVSKAEFSLFCKLEVWDQIVDALLKLGFKYVTFDLQGYVSGSMFKAVDGGF
ncbi:MAG: ATP-dependent sacrificial sulfur transferase LarE [Nitrososphaerota archaeon]|nr:ATP-dependent sacrificial sulfur transferase LarE [Nitrososphaerota archaeon]